ncbi:MAG: RluA family pseudouridine synthase [Planctomycetota bacterium]
MSEARRWTAEAEMRLDTFVTARLGAECSRAQVQGWIRAGRAVVDGSVCRRPGIKLSAGAVVAFDLPPAPAPLGPLLPEDLPVPILYQDEHLLVIDKPAGLSVHPGAGRRTGTLVNALLHLTGGALSSIGGEDRPGIVHRLDKDTTGVLVVARTDRAHRELARQFHDREVRKRYLALTEGVPRRREGTIDQPIGRDPLHRKRMTTLPGGRAAQTRYEVLEVFVRHALVACWPRTGRTHQLRVHLRSIGAPCAADAVYGRRARLTTRDVGIPGEERALLERQGLHAEQLELTHPTSGERVTFRSPLPADLQAALEALRQRPKADAGQGPC